MFSDLYPTVEAYAYKQCLTELLNQCSKDFVLVKEIKVATQTEDYSSRLTLDVDYKEYDTLAEAVQNQCLGDILICRADYI